MIRTSIYFAIWTMICMVGTIVVFYFGVGLSDGPGITKKDLESVGFLSMFTPVAGIIAGLLWALFHREGHRPGWMLYALLALLVVGISHVMVFGGLNIGDLTDLQDFAAILAFSFLVHGWLSVPVALAGTVLFVIWNRRRVRAVP